jgi:FtsP/CotA-like multicopper oxidase with cupredoxin domain
MYLSRLTSRVRMLEAANARKNRLEIVRALSHGQITKRDLIKWGLFSSAGALVAKNGLSPFATSAYAAVPTGTPPSLDPRLREALKFKQEMPRLVEQPRLPLMPNSYSDPISGKTETEYTFCRPGTATALGSERGARRTSYHSYYSFDNPANRSQYTNPVSGVGPVEGRPPVWVDPLGKKHDYFAHQRWDEFAPKVGYLLSLGQIKSGTSFLAGQLPDQEANSVWSFGSRYDVPLNPSYGTDLTKAAGYYGCRTGVATAPLMKMRYKEPVVCRIYNDLPVDRELNNGFGRNEISTHYHNAHNGAESDGACNAYHFPGTFYDYHWSSCLARHDWRSYPANSAMDKGFKPGDLRASMPADDGTLIPVEGDFREIQGTMWFHDHRFFFTAENVHKGNFGMINMYSGLDRGYEDQTPDGVNLRFPSGTAATWGNTDYDVNLTISNPAFDPHGQLYFDIFDTDGFLGDMLVVNGAYYPYMKVKERRYRFRTLNASMSRFIQLAVVDENGRPVPYHFVCNDGNLVNAPILMANGVMEEQGVAERYDIVVDFNIVKARGLKKAYLVNVLQQTNGRKPDGAVSLGQAMTGVAADPAVGRILEFQLDGPPAKADKSWDLMSLGSQGRLPALTEQIPLDKMPVARTRVVEWVRSSGDSRKTATGQCIPECGNVDQFPWSVKINGQAAHSLNATRIGALIRTPGEIEEWVYVNGGGGWDHPIHMHFEEGVTIDRGGAPIGPTEKLVRKDVWRLRPGGSVRFRVRFGEFGGAYVNHCHNTVHEDFAMLLRYQLLKIGGSDPQTTITPTPVPTPSKVTWLGSEVLPEADPINTQFFGRNGKV